MPQYKVVVHYADYQAIYNVTDVSPMPSGAVELTFEDGTVKIAQNFLEMDVIPQQSVEATQVLREALQERSPIINRNDI